MIGPGYLLALCVYLYAGWAMAESADSDRDNPTYARVIAYASFFLAWPLLMPWMPWRVKRKMKQAKRQQELK